MNRKNKIAFITPIYLPANLTGSSGIIREISEYLAKIGFDVSIITSNALTGRYWYDPIFGKKIDKKFEKINGVKVFRLSCNQFISSSCFILVRYLNFLLSQKLLDKLEIISNGPFLNGLGSILAKEKFDIIHSSPFPLNINRQVVSEIKKLDNKPKLIFTPFLHTELKEFKNPELAKIISNADIVHVVTNAEKLYVEKKLNLKNKKIVVIALFINFKKLSPIEKLNEDIKRFKDKYKLNGKKIVLFAGIKGYMKGAITLLNVINEIYRKNSSYVLITIGNDTPEWVKEKKKINPKFLLDFGYVDDKTKEIIFSACDVFCMPSISESFGLTYLEAWHKKKMVIGAYVPAVREIITKAKGGLLVKFNDSKDLQLKIYESFKKNNNSSRMGMNGYKYLLKNYENLKIFDKYSKLFSIS